MCPVSRLGGKLRHRWVLGLITWPSGRFIRSQSAVVGMCLPRLKSRRSFFLCYGLAVGSSDRKVRGVNFFFSYFPSALVLVDSTQHDLNHFKSC